MSSYKSLVNSLSRDPSLRQLSSEEIIQLRSVFLDAFTDLEHCCERHGLTVMLVGGSALGAVRHQGFIPWDDDFDVAMPRADFDKLKEIFEDELGDKYILSSPNYKNKANNRFPMILVKNTVLVEAGSRPEDEYSKIKIDIFILENVPKNKLHRVLKGAWCSALMVMGSYEDTYEHQTEEFKHIMYKTEEGKRTYDRRLKLGRFFSVFDFQTWMDLIDRACQYKRETGLIGIPSGRLHYFGEILPTKTFLPVSKGSFEGLEVNLPGNPDVYLCNLYGSDYMIPPPEDKRERHLILDIKFT